MLKQNLINNYGYEIPVFIFEPKGNSKGTLFISDGAPISYVRNWWNEQWTLELSKKIASIGYKVVLLDNSISRFRNNVLNNKNFEPHWFDFLKYSRNNLLNVIKNYKDEHKNFYMGVSWGSILYQTLPRKYKKFPTVLREVIPFSSPWTKLFRKDMKNNYFKLKILTLQKWRKNNNIWKFFIGELDKGVSEDMIINHFKLINSSKITVFKNSKHSFQINDPDGNFMLEKTMNNYKEVENYLISTFLN